MSSSSNNLNGSQGAGDTRMLSNGHHSPSSSTVLPLYANGTGIGQPPSSGSSKQSVTLTRKRPSARWRHASGQYRSKSGDFQGAFSSSSWGSLNALRRSPLAMLHPSNLTARARTTNLAVLLLLLTLVLSLLYNIRFYLHEHPLSGEKDRLPLSIRATLPQSNRLAITKHGQRKLIGDSRQPGGEDKGSIVAPGPTTDSIDLSILSHLVIVPGHAVWRGRTQEEAVQDENWVLEEMQKGGSVQTFIKHVMKGVETTVNDPSALLVFSGGQTRPAAQETEGDSYFRLAEALDLYRQYATPKTPNDASDQVSENTDAEQRQPPERVNVDKAVNEGQAILTVPTGVNTTSRDVAPYARATTEQFALDSYQNLIFSIARFKEMTGRYPTRITVVGFGMKRSRFTDVHRVAIRWPRNAFTYIGIDDVGETGQSYLGEKEYGLKPFLEDFYGCKGFLLSKRKKRNPYRRIHPYFTSNPLLRDLLEYCPQEGTTVFPKTLPWDGKA